MSERIHISLEDWARANAPTGKQIDDIAHMLYQSNEILDDMGFYPPPEPISIPNRFRRWIAERLARLAFKISPEVRDDYY